MIRKIPKKRSDILSRSRTYHLILVREVERTLSIFHEAEVQRLDSESRGIGAIVAGWNKLSPAEARLNVGRARSENRLVTRRCVSLYRDLCGL